MKRLDVIRIISDAYLLVWRERQDLAQIGAPIALVLGTASGLLSYFRPLPNGGEPTLSVGFILAGVVVAVVSIAGWVVFTVAWYRRCLLPAQRSTVSQELRWQRRHSLFLGRTVLIGLLTLLISMILALPISLLIAATGGAGGAVTVALWMAVVFIIEARLMLVFPAVTVDDLLSFRRSWSLSDGNAFRIAAVLILTSIPISIALTPIDWVLSTMLVSLGLMHSLAALFVTALVQAMLGLVVTACSVAGLSICYRILSSN